jgi:prophage antirepressor-like protein
MSRIVKYTCEVLAGASVNCIIENGEPWFKAVDVANALKYKDTDDAIRTHVADDDKRQQGSFNLNPGKTPGYGSSNLNPGETPGYGSSNLNPLETPGYGSSNFNPVKTTGLKGNWKIAKYINESGLYCLIFGSEMVEAKVFKHWVTREVLPQIRKTGTYMSHEEAVHRITHPTGETKLHYIVRAYITRKYPNVIISTGQGENQITEFQRMDAKAKGYTKGEPDLELKCKLGNGYTDVVAIELKNPNGSNRTTPEQDAYLERLRACNVTTLVTNDYDEVVIFLHEHYKKIQREHTRLLAIKDVPPSKTLNFATNENPQYWCNKLKNHTNFQEECEKRGLSKDVFDMKTKREIASILITFDKEHY